mmetsp:Transcript_21248/g.53492  ORF Transcript_21248/g.53492 Transcript_21248/m.53492 type:complete len:229 (+) Transcript_21248:1003-1689(+)
MPYPFPTMLRSSSSGSSGTIPVLGMKLYLSGSLRCRSRKSSANLTLPHNMYMPGMRLILWFGLRTSSRPSNSSGVTTQCRHARVSSLSRSIQLRLRATIDRMVLELRASDTLMLILGPSLCGILSLTALTHPSGASLEEASCVESSRARCAAPPARRSSSTCFPATRLFASPCASTLAAPPLALRPTAFSTPSMEVLDGLEGALAIFVEGASPPPPTGVPHPRGGARR